MCRIIAMFSVMLVFAASGCTFQANRASQAVDVNLDGIQPANGRGYINGEPQDMRRSK